MSNFFCPNERSDCVDPANPIMNYSAEATDDQIFLGVNYGTQLEPPLGKQWFSSSCVGRVRSIISQEHADFLAQQANLTCLSREWPDTDDNPNPDQPPVIFTPSDVFYNTPQSCEKPCPDGEIFTYTIPGGTIAAFNQATANAWARSIACNKAIDKRICIGSLSPEGSCVGSDYSGQCEVTGPVNRYTITIADGFLPPGINLSQDENTAMFDGVPSAAGTYSILLRAEDVDGNFMQKVLRFFIVEIAQDSLPDGNVGQPYSQTMTTVGPTEGAVTWSVVSGTLPTGLTLNSSTGQITGTPTTEGTFTFTVAMTDER